MQRLAGVLLSGTVVLAVYLYATAERLGDAARSIPTTETVVQEMQSAQWISWTVDDPSGAVREVRLLRPPGSSVAEFLDVVKGFTESAPKKATWVSGGSTFMVVTPQRVGEPVQDWCDRHDDLVEAAQAEFPPD